ncbi:MAG: ribonuclease P protein component [Synechococcaceae cyanobacterium]|nr:ribonuclease P protein component [Synechococcaceae cyanobacterium]
MALPARHRLRGLRVFERIYRRGRRFDTPLLQLRVLIAVPALLPPDQIGHPASPWRCAVVVSSKVSKRAVVRNRLRRRLQAELLACRPHGPEPLWLLLSVRPGSAELCESQLLGECRQLLRKAGLCHDLPTPQPS